MKRVFVIFITCLCVVSCYGQCDLRSMSESKCISSKDIVLYTCKAILKNKCTIQGDETDTVMEILKKFSLERISMAVKDADVFSYGGVFDSIVCLTLEEERLYFRVDIDPPFFKDLSRNVEDVFDSEGKSIAGCSDFLQIPAIINDSDGYVNVRSGKSSQSKIVGRIKERQIFFFIPSLKSDWWQVFLPNGILGYVHKSRIREYRYCPSSIQRKMEHMMAC